jgi:hypothetical protein
VKPYIHIPYPPILISIYFHFPILTCIQTLPLDYIWACSPSPSARHKGWFFGPTQAQPGPVASGLGLARPEGAGHAWASPRHVGRHGTAR